MYGEALTKGEQDVHNWVTQGLSNEQVAAQLGIVEKTVKFHLTNIFKKLGIESRSELIAQVNGNLRKTERFYMDQSKKAVEIIPGAQDKRNMGIVHGSQESKIDFINEKFKVGDTVTHLHKMMTEVTKEEINVHTVNAACNCIARLNETINTAITAARFLNDK